MFFLTIKYVDIAMYFRINIDVWSNMNWVKIAKIDYALAHKNILFSSKKR